MINWNESVSDNRPNRVVNFESLSRILDRIINYEEWMEVEDETRKLQDLVEAQRLRIRELSQLLLEQSKYDPLFSQSMSLSLVSQPRFHHPLRSLQATR